MGLGLSYCKAIVQEMNGSINCRSSPNRGTEFTFVLPVSCSPSDRGLTHEEEISHQFLVAKLIESYLSQVRRNNTEDRVAEVTEMASNDGEEPSPLKIPILTGSKLLSFAPLQHNV